jgi:hypothetical protein
MLRCTFEQIIVPYDCDHNHMILSFAYFDMFESVFEHTIEQDFDNDHMIDNHMIQSYDTIPQYATHCFRKVRLNISRSFNVFYKK